MEQTLERFYRYIQNKKVAFLGIGVSNAPLIKMFAQKRAKVYACDKKSREALGKTAGELEKAGAVLILGEDYLSKINEMDIVFRTPGMRFTLPELDAARKNGVAVTSEMEVFFDLCPCPIIAVTGSDGKTTTSTVTAEMLRREGRRVHLGGNIGRALLPEIESIDPGDIAVVELSSFQLISMRRSADIAVVTNVSPNHLDMHKDMDEYVNAKKNIFLHQNAFGTAVLNLDNAITASFMPEVRGTLLQFSRKQQVQNGAFLREDGMLCAADNGRVQEILPAAEIFLPGMHNVENYLTAFCAVRGLVSAETMRKTAREFRGVEHRIEFVRELDGVKYYNDSIATTPTRTIAGLNAFSQKVILIAGGYDKLIPFDILGPKIVEKVRHLVLLGATADKIEESVRKAPGYSDGNPVIERADNLAEAVSLARKASRPGDILLLSPACASFGQFKNFEERGEIFKDMVHSL